MAQYFAPAPQCSHPRSRPRQPPQAQFFFGVADFFSAKRLFLRAARDVSGVRSSPTWARVVIKLKMSFQALSHSPSHERAKALTSPPPDFLFSSIPPSHKPHYPIQKKEHSLLVLPSVNVIINFATKFFEMFTKKQSEHPQKVFQVFQVFRVFQVFHFAFGPQNSPVLVQIRTNPANRNYSAMQ